MGCETVNLQRVVAGLPAVQLLAAQIALYQVGRLDRAAVEEASLGQLQAGGEWWGKETGSQ